MAKVMISIDDNLLSRVDEVADEMYTSRSGYIANALARSLNEYEVAKSLKEMSVTLRKFADNPSCDEELKQKMSEFQTLVTYLPLAR